MPHKFKIGTVVNYCPVKRLVSAPRGTYIVTGLAAGIPHQAPQRGLRVATEGKLLVA